MPHPLAHPAAVMPLRRYCPRWLSFPALLVGSIIPDAGYLFGEFQAQDLSHEFIGGIVFCLPAGLLMLGVLHLSRPLLVGLLPGSYRRLLLPSCQRPLGSLWTIVISLLIGIWTHQILDSVTHKDAWLAMHSELLEATLVESPLRLRVCHCIWYALSFAGIIWLGMIYQRWLAGIAASSKSASDEGRLLNAVLLAALLMVVSVAFRMVYHWAAVYWEGALNLFILMAFLVRTRPRLDTN